MVSLKKWFYIFPRSARDGCVRTTLRFGLTFNILRAISAHEGLWFLEIIGENAKNEEGLQYLQEKRVEIQL
jgi:hypothetical protein